MKRRFISSITHFLVALAVVSLPTISNIKLLTCAKGQTKNQRGIKLESTVPIKDQMNPSKRFALLIGINDYQDEHIPKLSGAANDAKALAEVLTEFGGFPSKQVFILASNQPPASRPTRANILRKLWELSAVMPKGSMLLLAFSGHGIERGDQKYILPEDAQVTRDTTILEYTSISFKFLKTYLVDMGISQLVMIFDACSIDPGGKSVLTETYNKGMGMNMEFSGMEMTYSELIASRPGKPSYEYKEKKMGYFTWAIVEALRGNAANERGEVTVGEMVKQVEKRVREQTSLDLGVNRIQLPYALIEGNNSDKLVLSVLQHKP